MGMGLEPVLPYFSGGISIHKSRRFQGTQGIPGHQSFDP